MGLRQCGPRSTKMSSQCRWQITRAGNVRVPANLRRPCRRMWKRLSASAVGESAVKATADDGKRGSDVPQSSIVVGGGPCGLAAAMYLSQMGWPNIEVWDKLPPPQPSDDGFWGTAERSYSFIISAKGQAVLHDIGAYDRVVKCCAPSIYRQEWTPERPEGKVTVYTDDKQNPTPQAIQRDRLVACMLEHIEEAHAGRVRVRHSMQLQELAVQAGGKVSLKWSQGSPPGRGAAHSSGNEAADSEGTTETEFVVGADGANSAVRTLLEEQGLGEVRSVKLEEKRRNTRVYKNIMMPVQHTEYSAPDGSGICRLAERSAAGRVLESLPSREGNQLALVLYNVDDEEVKSIATEEEAAAFLQREFPNIFPIIPRSEIAAFPQRPPNKLQTFQYVWPDLHYSDNVVLAGDAIHTMKPYFGLGLNSALDDVRWLSQCLRKHPGDRAAALRLYSQERAEDAQALVLESRKADESIWNLVFPLIMDNAFNKLFPGLFRGSMFKTMELEGLRFSDVRRRKRLDRIVQFSMLGGVLAAVCAAVV